MPGSGAATPNGTASLDNSSHNDNMRTPLAGGTRRMMSPLPTPAGTGRSAPPPSTGTQQRRRAYSWRGESPPYEKPATTVDADSNPVKAASEKWLPIIGQEARCVAALVAGAALIQCSISLLLRLASFSYPLSLVGGNDDDMAASIVREHTAAWWECIMAVPSIAAGCIIRVIPPQVVSNNCPGFIYASAWLLMGIKNWGGSLPHIPSRICEACLGRLSATECLVVVLAQLVCTVSTVTILQYSNTTGIAALSPIEYTSRAYGDGNPWIVDYFHELFVNTVFTVALQVVPVLLRLNRGSPWLTLLFVYPLYTYGVDSVGKASTLSPSLLFALSSTRQHLSQLGRCIPQVLSGVLAGKIMKAYFPDDSKRA